VLGAAAVQIPKLPAGCPFDLQNRFIL